MRHEQQGRCHKPHEHDGQQSSEKQAAESVQGAHDRDVGKQATERTGQQAGGDLDDHDDGHEAKDAAPLGIKGVEMSKPAADPLVEAKATTRPATRAAQAAELAYQAGAQAAPGKQGDQDDDNDVVEVHGPSCSAAPPGLPPACPGALSVGQQDKPRHAREPPLHIWPAPIDGLLAGRLSAPGVVRGSSWRASRVRAAQGVAPAGQPHCLGVQVAKEYPSPLS